MDYIEENENVINLDGEKEKSYFEIHWRNVNYTVNNSWINRKLKNLQGFRNIPKTKTILENVSGRVSSGELVAFMGPSGAGKSTLMECVVGRRINGRTGDVFIVSNDLNDIRVSFIAQKNNFLDQLTVRETILFAARLQISAKAMHGKVDPLFDENGTIIITKPGGIEYCRILTDRIIVDLSLEQCADNRIKNCSGGQLKRLAIAQELVSRPRILVLDEPTSGLDSSAALQLVEMLRMLCESKLKISVLASIHQPSYKVLKLFHKMYVLSKSGDVVYNDSPSLMNDQLHRFGIVCPDSYNPADFIIEIASGDHALSVLTRMVTYNRKQFEKTNESIENGKPLSYLNEESSFPDWTQAWILSQRNMLITMRDPFVFGARFLSTLAVPAFLASLFGTTIGIRGGCPPKFDADFEPEQLDYISDEIEAEIRQTNHNVGNVFFAVLFCMFNALMTTCLGFPWEMIVFKTEKQNFWYSNMAFFFGKSIAEIPIQLLFLIVYWPFQHFLQNQILEFWRLFTICLNLFLVQLIAQTFGYINGSLFMYNPAASIFLGPTLWIIPFFVLCGLIIKIKNLTSLFNILSYFVYLRFSMEGVLVSIYGFNRCGYAKNDLKDGRDAFVVWMSAMLGVYSDYSDQSENRMNGSNYTSIGSASERFVEEVIDSISGDFLSNTEEVRSLVMNVYELEDSFLRRSLFINTLYLIVLRIIALLIISYKVRAQK